MVYSQIWLNLPQDDCHFFYIYLRTRDFIFFQFCDIKDLQITSNKIYKIVGLTLEKPKESTKFSPFR